MKINQKKVGTILTYVHMILGMVVGLVYTPFMLDLLEQSEYGLFGTAGSLTSYLVFLSFGVAGAYLRYVMQCRAEQDEEGEKKLNGMFVAIFAFFSVLVIIVGGVLIFASENIFRAKLNDWELYSIKWIMFCTILNYIITFLLTPITLNIMSHERYFFAKLLNMILADFINPIVNIIILLFFPCAISLSVITLVIALISAIIQFYYAYNKLNMRFIFRGFDFSKLKGIFLFSGYLLINDITNIITNSTDKLALGILSGTAAVAIYTVGTNFTNYFSTFSTSVSSVFAPSINRIVAEARAKNQSPDPELNKIFIKVGRIQFLILTLVLIGFFCLGKQFVIVWAGEKYVYAFWIALFLMLAPYIPFIQNTGLEIQKAKNMHKARSIIYFFVALINIALTVPAVIYFSNGVFPEGFAGIAAAFMTFLCVVCGQVIFMNVYYQKKVGVDIITFWKNILRMIPGMLIPLAFGLILSRVIYADNYLLILVEAIMIALVYVVSVYFLSMNKYERKLFTSPIKKLFSRK